MADLTDIDNVAPADSLYQGSVKINAIRARLDELYTVLSDITAVEANQVENLGTTTVSATQWGYLGELDQSLITTDSPTFAGLTLTGGFTLGGILTLAGNVVCDDYAFTGVGDMTFTAGSILASGSTAADTLILKANDTTCITLTTGATDKVEIAALNALTAIANLDIGTYTFTCAGLIDDTLTSGRVVFASTGGLLADDADFTFDTATLTVTNIAAFNLTGKLTAGANEIEGSAFDINGGTVDAITSLTVANAVDIGNYNLRALSFTADSLTSGRVPFASTNGLLIDDADFTFATDTLTVTKIGAFEATGAIDFGNQAMTNVDINSGAIDGTIIGANSAAALTCTTFTSTGIDDNADANAITIDSSETVTIGNLLSVTGGQIKFPASQNASADVNTLDDYEEGTWTAAFACGTSGTITLDGAYDTGTYVKIGKMVVVTGTFVVDSVSSPVGSLSLTGLPFACGNASAGVSFRYGGLEATATTTMNGRVNATTQVIIIEHFTAGVAAAAAADVKAGTYFTISAAYFIS